MSILEHQTASAAKYFRSMIFVGMVFCNLSEWFIVFLM